MNRAKKAGVVQTVSEWNGLDSDVAFVFVRSNSCNEASVPALNASRLSRLKELRIGDECFMNVNELIVIGLSELKSVVIGNNSFTQKKNDYGNNLSRHFYLKNCPKLKSLKTGVYSFSDYSVCEIENVDALEVIEIGDLNEVSNSFYYASLELKSVPIHSE